MCTTANNREIIEPRIIQLVRELTAAPATDEVADALKPVMEQVVDQAASSSPVSYTHLTLPTTCTV